MNSLSDVDASWEYGEQKTLQRAGQGCWGQANLFFLWSTGLYLPNLIQLKLNHSYLGSLR